MRSMRLRLDLGDAIEGTLLEAFCVEPALDRELILGGQLRDGVETLTTYVHGDPDVYESLLEEAPSILDHEVAHDGAGCFAFLRRELGDGGHSVTRALARETVVVVPPIEVRSDRTVTLTLVGRSADLAAAVEGVPPAVQPTVERVSSEPAPGRSVLSERQREALEAAHRVGYYEVPRRNGIEPVADELDCAISTASELLRRGEAALVGRALGPDP